MTATITFFPVGNGDMTLIETATGKKILIDCNIREGDEHPDVLAQLRNTLTRDDSNRLYVDLFIWTHPDEDHCRGMKSSFHLGKSSDWSSNADKIFIRCIWASPIVYRRASVHFTLCPDAKALNAEIKRRVEFHKEQSWNVGDGERVALITHSEDDQTDDVKDIVIALDEQTSNINGQWDETFKCRILGPAPKSDLDEDEDNLGKNHSSIIASIELASSTRFNANHGTLLSAGDAEVICWEHLWQRIENNVLLSTEWLNYDVMNTPHHCSWHSISHDSWSKEEDPEISANALNALSQANQGAFIIASCNSIKDDDNDPPCIGAKREYQRIVDDVDGQFKCVADHKVKGDNVPLVIQIDDGEKKILPAVTLFQSGAFKSSVNRTGGDGYAGE